MQEKCLSHCFKCGKNAYHTITIERNCMITIFFYRKKNFPKNILNWFKSSKKKFWQSYLFYDRRDKFFDHAASKFLTIATNF